MDISYVVFTTTNKSTVNPEVHVRVVWFSIAELAEESIFEATTPTIVDLFTNMLQCLGANKTWMRNPYVMPLTEQA